jgi:hypothetical protein
LTLVAALMFAPAQVGAAQTPVASQDAQSQGQTQAPPSAQAAPPEEPSEKPLRPSKRKPRASKRRPAASGERSFDEPRVSRDGGPVRQDLTLEANIQGGYDDNVTAGLGTGSGTAPTAMASGATGLMNGTLSYFRGNTRHALTMDGTGTLTAYPGYLDSPAPGAVARIGATTTVGRDMTIDVSERAGYEPFFNVLSTGAGAAPLPPGVGEAAPAADLFERRSVSSRTSISLDRRWGRSDATSLGYTYGVWQYTNDDYGGGTSHAVTGDYRRRLAAGVRARARYRYRNLEYEDSTGALRPMREHRLEAGPDLEKSLSRSRQLSFSFSAGAARIETISSVTGQPFDDWVPTGRASLTLTLSPDWSVDAGYRREFSLFYGATDEVYTTDTASLSLGGFLVDRVRLSLGATYGNWQTVVASGVNETLNVYGGTVQLNLLLTDAVTATAGYYYYYHRYSNPAALPEGFPADYDRHAIRAGISFWLPLAGTSTQPQERRR